MKIIPRQITRQRGVALLLAITLILVIAGLFTLFPQMSRTAASRDSDVTTTSLAQAREALIAYAASRPKQPGSLPCPDVDNDGQSDSQGSICASYLGRLPWRTLGLGPLKDGAGECLWYALSPIFRNVLAANARSVSEQLNPSLSGQITVWTSTGTALPAPTNPVIAVIFAPGTPLGSQNRLGSGTSVCGGNLDSANYLDAALAINNASGNNIVIAADRSDSFNDRLEWITSDQLFATTNKRVLNTLRGNIADSTGFAYYFKQMANYPFAATSVSSGQAVPSTLVGLVPYVDLVAIAPFDSDTNTWLTANGWYQKVTYSVTPSQDKATIAIGAQTLACGNGSNVCP